MLLGVFGAVFRSVGSPDHCYRAYSCGRNISEISTWRSGGFFRSTETSMNKHKLSWYRPEVALAVVWALCFCDARLILATCPNH